MTAELDHLYNRVHAVEGDLHQVKTNHAVLRSEFDTAMDTLVGMGADMRTLREISQQQQGAVKFVRAGWVAVGGILTLAAVLIAYLTWSAGR
jgi:hypothetical protein